MLRSQTKLTRASGSNPCKCTGDLETYHLWAGANNHPASGLGVLHHSGCWWPGGNIIAAGNPTSTFSLPLWLGGSRILRYFIHLAISNMIKCRFNFQTPISQNSTTSKIHITKEVVASDHTGDRCSTICGCPSPRIVTQWWSHLS